MMQAFFQKFNFSQKENPTRVKPPVQWKMIYTDYALYGQHDLAIRGTLHAVCNCKDIIPALRLYVSPPTEQLTDLQNLCNS